MEVFCVNIFYSISFLSLFIWIRKENCKFTNIIVSKSTELMKEQCDLSEAFYLHVHFCN